MHNVDYFDSVVPGNQIVSLYCNEIGISILSLNDPSQVISFSKYADCSLHMIHQKMVIYLNKKSNQFIIVYANSPYFNILQKQIEKATLPWYKKIRKIKPIWLITLFIGFILAIYFTAVQVVPLIGLKVISTETEIELGNQINQAILSDQKIDQQRTKWINAFANELQLSTKYPIKISVVEQKEVNAFALPGGYIIVHEGILQNIHSADELAALLGHETAHVNLRHSLKSMLGNVAAGMLISLALSDASGILSTIVQNANFLRTMHYSRGLEKAADEEGMKFLLRNQINPIAMNQLMKDLKASNEDMPEAMAFLSSHPTTEERIKHSLEFAYTYKQQTFQPKPSLDSIWLQLQY